MAASCNYDEEKYSLEFNIQRQMEMLQLLVDKDEMLRNGRNDTQPMGKINTESTLGDIPEFEYHGYDCSFAKQYSQNVKMQCSSKTDKSNEEAASAADATGFVGIANAASGAAGSAGDAGLAGAACLNGAAGYSDAAYSDGAAGATCASDLPNAEGGAYREFAENPAFIELMEKIERSNNNPVVRIFRLMQSMHNYLKDEFPSTQPNYFPSEYVYDWPEKYTMPKTLSIPYQLQFASRKLNKFIIRLRRILKRNENLDYMKYKECNDSLTSLEGLAKELDSIKELKIRHDNYEFKTDAMKALASTIEMLIQRINDQIREAHLLITVFNWEMDLEHRQSQTMINERQKTLDYAIEMITKSTNEELKKRDPEYQAALKAKYKLPERFNLDYLSERVAKYDELWDEIIANPGKFFQNPNIPPEGLLPKSETSEKKSDPVPAPTPNSQFHNHQKLNEMSFENVKLPKETPIERVIPLNNIKSEILSELLKKKPLNNTERVAEHDDLRYEKIANPRKFFRNYDIPPEGETPKKKSVPVPAPTPNSQFHNHQKLNEVSFENVKLPKEAPFERVIPLNNTERVAKHDDLRYEKIANPRKFFRNYNIPPEGETPKKKPVPVPAPTPTPTPQFHNHHGLNEVSFENVKLPKEAPIDHVIPLNYTQRVAKHDDLWYELIADPSMFLKKYNIPQGENSVPVPVPTPNYHNHQELNVKLPKEEPFDSVIPLNNTKSENLSETLKKKPISVPAPIPTLQFHNHQELNEVSFENVELPKEVAFDRVTALKTTERPLKPTHQFG